MHGDDGASGGRFARRLRAVAAIATMVPFVSEWTSAASACNPEARS